MTSDIFYIKLFFPTMNPGMIMLSFHSKQNSVKAMERGWSEQGVSNGLDVGSRFMTIIHFVVFASSQSVLLTPGSAQGQTRCELMGPVVIIPFRCGKQS